MKLRAAVTFDRAKHVAGQALRMNTNKRRHLGTHLAFVYDDKFFVADERAVAGDQELADLSRQLCGRHAFDSDRAARPRAIGYDLVLTSVF